MRQRYRCGNMIRMDLPRIGATDDAMCLAHIHDAHLLRRLSQYAEPGDCTLCPQVGLRPRGPIVNLERVAEIVDGAALSSYNHEGWFLDGEQLLEPMNNAEVVESLLDGCVASEVFDLVCRLLAGLIMDELDWFEPYDMDAEAGIEFEWDDFEQSVKHGSRLLAAPVGPRPETAPERNYEFVRSLLVFAEDHAGLVRSLPPGTVLHRARVARDARELEGQARLAPESELGPAPEDRASAGRMNAQGVPMFYAAFDAETACAEVASHSPYNEVVTGAWVLQRALRLLDLTESLPVRSVFDDAPLKEGDQRLSSLAYYVEGITRPVILDGLHPVDYAPTQILTDAFRYWAVPLLDGIVYPSLVHKGGRNVVLFYGNPRWFERLGNPAPRMQRFEREEESGHRGPLFVIDPTTVRRYRVDREITIARSGH